MSKILCIGDYINDVYIFGKATRLCQEAPCPVIVPRDKREERFGGIGLVAYQLSVLCEQMVASRHRSFSTKTRIYADDHMICRVDEDSQQIITEEMIVPQWADIFVISDYGKGGMTEQLARRIVETGKPVFCDAKTHWHWYEGKNVTIFPNNREAQIGPTSIDPTQVVHKADFGRIVHKLGKDGCRLQEPGIDFSLPAEETRIVDVCGAGDIFMASFVYAYSIQLPTKHCLEFANAMAAESCRHLGTFVVGKAYAEAVLDRFRFSKESVAQAVRDLHDSMNARPLHPEQLDLSSFQGVRIDDIQGEGSQQASRESLDCLQNLQLVQTPPESPSVPSKSIDTPALSDRKNSDSRDTK